MAGVADLAGLDDGGADDFYGVEFAFELGGPEVEEFAEDREGWGDVEVLPDIGLQKARVIGQVIEDFGGGEAIVLQLQT